MKTEDKEGEKAAEQSRSQAAGKDHLGARCVICLLSSAAEPSLYSLTVLLPILRDDLQTDESVLYRSRDVTS